MKILLLTIRPLHNGPRMVREIEALKDDFVLAATGTTPPREKNVHFISSETFSFTHLEYTLGKIYRILTLNNTFLGKYFTTQMKVDKLLSEVKPDTVIVHDPAYLPYVVDSDTQCKVVFNAHEYHPLEVEGDKKWERTWGKIYDHIYRNYLPKIDLLINVNQEIADKCEEEYGVKSLVIPNASPYADFSPKTKSNGFPWRFIHHGIPNPDRKLEWMVEAFGMLGEDYQLDLMLVNNGSGYYTYLQKIISEVPNVRMIPPVDFSEIIPFISKYDLALYSLAPNSFNNRMALPNKFFEFVQARLPLVIGPSPVMSKYVKKFDIGTVADDFSPKALAKAIKSLTKKDLERFQENLEPAALELSMEHFERELVQRLKELN